MALEEILDRIEKDTKQEEGSIIAKSQQEAEETLEQAKKQAELILERYKKRAEEEADVLRKQLDSSATLEGRYEIESARERIERKYLDDLKIRISKARDSEAFYSFILKEIKSAAVKLGPGAVIYMDKMDALKMKENGFPFAINVAEVDPLGGAKVTSADGKMIIDLTITELLRKKDERLRKIVRDFIR